MASITIEPRKRGGKPCIRGLRITVYDVLDWLAAGMTEVQKLADFQDLDRNEHPARVPPLPPIANAASSAPPEWHGCSSIRRLAVFAL